MSCSKFSDPDFLARIEPKTLDTYKRSLTTFTSWAMEEGAAPRTPEEWDDLLVEFKHAHPALKKTTFVTIVAALEFFMPNVKKQLHWSHAITTGWGRRASIKHTVPLTMRPAKLMAMHMACRGKQRMGIGLLLQTATGFRPGELIQLLPEHILFPEDQGRADSEVPVVIVLGARHGTKLRRAQVALLPKKYVMLWQALHALRKHTREGFYLFPYSLMTYRNEIQAIERLLGVKVGWGAHSPRAGYATDARLSGVPFEEIREGGRWQSDSSLRTYLDIVSSAAVIRTLRLQGLAEQLNAAEAHWPRYFC